MKKISFIIIATVFSSVIATFILFPVNVQSQKKAQQEVTTTIPDSVYSIIRTSCLYCHSTGGKSPASDFINFSKWDSYQVKKQAKLAKKICNKASNGTMPPSWEKKPELNPTPAQIKTICDWASALKMKK
jgi:hypothetical protein